MTHRESYFALGMFAAGVAVGAGLTSVGGGGVFATTVFALVAVLAFIAAVVEPVQ